MIQNNGGFVKKMSQEKGVFCYSWGSFVLQWGIFYAVLPALGESASLSSAGNLTDQVLLEEQPKNWRYRMPLPSHGLGAIRDTHDPRDHIFESARAHLAVGPLPPAVDLRSLCADVRDQGQQGSCTGFALRDLREFIEKRDNMPTTLVELSPAFIYYEERKREHTTNDCDAGAMLRDGLKVLKSVGVCPEQDAPYNSQTCSAPDGRAASDARQFTIDHFQRILTLAGMKQALAARNGCVMSIQVYESFESPVKGHIPMPQPNEQLLGEHAIFVCGYQDDPNFEGGGFLIAQNSWGTGFGDQGFIYLPYAYVTPPLTMDMWTANV